MDYIIPIPITQYLLDLPALVAKNPLNFLTGIIRYPPGKLNPIRYADSDAGPTVELYVNAGNS